MTRFGLKMLVQTQPTLRTTLFMILLSLLSVFPARVSHALLGHLRVKLGLINTNCDGLNDKRSKVYSLTAQTPCLTQDLTPNAPTLTRWLAHTASNNAWLRALLPVHPTAWLTPCSLPVAANKNRENQHETHVIQRHPRRRDACSHR